MATRIGINGFGRIGRQVLKAIIERHPDELEVVAVNDLVDTKTNVHLFKYDSNYGTYPGTVEAKDSALVVDGRPIHVFAESAPSKIPWGEVGADIVVESTGRFTDAKDAAGHLEGGAKKVIISAPARNEDLTVVLGVNQEMYDPGNHKVISNASCTTNGLAPVAKVLFDKFGIQKGFLTTVHAYTNTQRLLDLATPDLRDARAAGLNIVPAATGAARAVGLVIPQLQGRFTGMAFRVPTPTVSVIDFVALLDRDVTLAELNEALREASEEGPMAGDILGYTTEPLVSMDLKGDPRSSIVSAIDNMVIGGNLVKVISWYDNEWGYSCRVGDLAAYMADRGL
ncbi:MAG TPA: type I glyceraldehyde-3-phosphate dehydrogenase [Dehalococcoidia bacterium]|nr:type I glyceraldehyde-3-phosphate dehydrogenase [Dehalococcoidia bacterium]